MLVVKDLGQIDYQLALEKMQHYTQARTDKSADEIWFCEHPATFTLGRHADPQHVLDAHNIPLISTDRGGQVTYHGPGQLMVYCLFDLRRYKLGIAQFVYKLEESVIVSLRAFNIAAERRSGMPGVYVKGAKICSIGLRVQHGATYHGLSLNVQMDLTPFSYINPCGYQALKVTQIADFITDVKMNDVKKILFEQLTEMLK